jgi:uncharacterized membrane protein YfcA
MWRDPALAAFFTPTTLAMLWLGGFLGAVASGGAGFAFALAAASVWLHVFDPVHTAFLVLVCSTLLQFGTIGPLIPHIQVRRLWPFVAGGLAGIPLGVVLLTYTNPGTLKMAVGIFLAAFGLYALLAPRLPVIAAGGRIADAAVGFAGGVLGGLGGYSGVLPTIWTQFRGWPKSEARAVYQPFIIVVQIATMIVLGVTALDKAGMLLLLAVLPALLIGGWVGWRLYGHLDERRFRQFLALLLVVSGVTLVI